MAMNLNITFTDIEKRLRSFDLSDVITDVDEAIEAETAVIETTVASTGLDPDQVTSTDHRRMYHTCRMIVMFRVTAEIMIDFSHEYAKAAQRRFDRADLLERRILDVPEVFIDGWDTHKNTGSWGYSSDDEEVYMKGFNSWMSGSMECMQGA